MRDRMERRASKECNVDGQVHASRELVVPAHAQNKLAGSTTPRLSSFVFPRSFTPTHPYLAFNLPLPPAFLFLPLQVLGSPD